MIEQGKHKVKIASCFTGESSEKKTPYYGIEFEIVGTTQSIFWLAYLSDTEFIKNGKKTTLKNENLLTLKAMGFKGRSLSDMSDDSKEVSDVFMDIKDDITIMVEHEEYTTNDGEIKTAAKVKYVNIGSQGPARFDHEQARVKFKSVDGDLLRIMNNGPKPQEAETKPETSESFSSDDVPF